MRARARRAALALAVCAAGLTGSTAQVRVPWLARGCWHFLQTTHALALLTATSP